MSKITKKSLAILIIAVLLSSLIPNLISYADEQPTLLINNSSSSEKSVYVGDTVDIEVTISGLPSNIKQLAFGINFDSEYLEPVYTEDQVEDNEIYFDNVSDLISSGINNAALDVGGNRIAIAIGSIGATKLNTSGTAASFQFKLLKSPGNEGTVISVTNVKYSEGTADSEEIEIEDPNCSITIKGIVPMTGLTSETISKTLYVGEKATVSATKLPTDTTDETAITYTSSNSSVATVDSNGVVTAVANGSATITAKCGDYSVTCGTITVVTPLASVSLDKTSATIHKGAELQLTATPNANVSNSVEYTWTSSNENVATVNDSGKVTATSVGTSVITVTATDGTFTKTATCNITVDSPLTGLELTSSENVYLEIGGTTTAVMKATPVPADTTDDKTITYSSSDNAVATVDSNGTITAVSEGTAKITATCGNYSVECTVAVTIHINSIEITSGNFELYVAQNPVTLSVTYDPSVFTDQGAVEWSVSDEAVVKVENGTVTALKPGKATVTATLKSNPEIYDEITIIVPEVKAAGVVINKSSVEIEKYADEDTQLNVILVEPEGYPTTDKLEDLEITWASSDENVVKVEKGETGYASLLPVSSGTATITVKVGDYDEKTCTVTVVCSLQNINLTTENDADTTLVIKDENNLPTLQLVVEKTPTDADVDVANATFKSSATSVATVDEAGLITAVNPGTAVITATLDGISKTIEITVEAILTDVEIENETEDLVVYKNKTAQLNVNLIPSYATIIPDAKWSSNDTSVATVDSNGVVTGVKEGTTTITVSYTHEDGEIVTASRTVVVKEVKATGVTITEKPESVLKNEKSTLDFEITTDGDAEDLTDEIVWKSSDSSIAYVVYEDGKYKVIGASEGTASITLTVGNYSDSFDVEVKEVHIESLTASIDVDEITEGNQVLINVTVNPTDTTDSKEFTFTVENESVAKIVIAENGLAYVKGVNAGKTIVTVKSENGVETSFEVTVVAATSSSTTTTSGSSSDSGSSNSVSDTVSGLVSSPSTGDMNILALVIMAIASLAGMIFIVKKK